jgi:hypothetical protein
MAHKHNPTSYVHIPNLVLLYCLYSDVSNENAFFFMYRENVNPSWAPQIGQKFRNLDDAWSFWVNYGGRAGFEVRKKYTNESKFDEKVTSCRYMCAKEGF